MSMMKRIDQALNEYVRTEITPKLSDDVRREIGLCRTSLFFGPVYLTVEGEECSMFDADYDHPHDFVRGCRTIGDALDELDEVDVLYVDADGFVGTSEPQGEEIDGEWYEPVPYYVVDRRQVVSALVGRELAHHVA